MEREVVVRGQGEARGLPDRAVVRVTVDAEAPSSDEAYSAAAQLVRGVDGVLEEHRPSIERVVTAGLVVQPKSRWKKGETVRTGWRASRTSVVEVAGLDRLGELLAEVVAAGGAVVGPSWELDPGHPAHDEARRMAAADARRRTEAYAEALGLTVGGVAWVAEPGLRQPREGAGMPARSTAWVDGRRSVPLGGSRRG